MARATRISRNISDDQFANLEEAFCHAATANAPLNHLITIHWENIIDGDVDELKVRQYDGRFRENIRKWLERKGVVFHCIWVIERGPKGGGLHVHLLVHIPRSLRRQFMRKIANWTKVPFGVPNEQYVIGIAAPRSAGESPTWQLKRLYGEDPEYRRAFNYVTKDHTRETILRGKRCGFSQNLGPKARARSAHQARQSMKDRHSAISLHDKIIERQQHPWDTYGAEPNCCVAPSLERPRSEIL